VTKQPLTKQVTKMLARKHQQANEIPAKSILNARFKNVKLELIYKQTLFIIVNNINRQKDLRWHVNA